MQSEEAQMMRQTLRQIAAEADNERKMLNDFQQQKEKLELTWIAAKKQREDLKMSLRSKLRQKQDLEEKNAFELKIYKQKVKHLLHEHQGSMTAVRLQGELSLKELEDGQRGEARELWGETRATTVARKETEIAHKDLYKAIKLEQEKKVMVLRQEFERRARDMRDKYEQLTATVLADMEARRKEEVERLEKKKAQHIASLMHEHKRAFEDIKNYYRDIKYANLEMIKGLREDVEKLKEDDLQLQKEVNNIARINRKLSRPLEINEKKAAEMRGKLKLHASDVDELAQLQDSLVSLAERFKNMTWEHEVLLQKHERVVKERGELRHRLERSVQEVRQKTAFRGLVLERKVVATAQDLEKTEAALSEVLASTSLSSDVVGELKQSLEDVLMAKNKVRERCDELSGLFSVLNGIS